MAKRLVLRMSSNFTDAVYNLIAAIDDYPVPLSETLLKANSEFKASLAKYFGVVNRPDPAPEVSVASPAPPVEAKEEQKKKRTKVGGSTVNWENFRKGSKEHAFPPNMELRKIRATHRLSVSDVGCLINQSGSSISAYEIGRYHTPDHVARKLEEYFNLPMGTLQHPK